MVDPDIDQNRTEGRPSGLAIAALCGLLAVMIVITAVGRLFEWLADLAIRAGDALLLVFQWVLVAGLGFFALLAIIDVLELIGRRIRHRKERIASIKTCARPSLRALRGETDTSPIDQFLARILEPACIALSLRPSTLGSTTRAVLMEEFPSLLARRHTIAQIDSLLFRPAFRQLHTDAAKSLRDEIQRSCTPFRRPMWRIRRAWNRVTLGRLGLKQEEANYRPDPQLIIDDEARFLSWAHQQGWSRIGLLESLIWAPQQQRSSTSGLQLSESQHTPPSLPTTSASPRVHSPPVHHPPTDPHRAQILEALQAADLKVRELNQILEAQHPWLDPPGLLDSLIEGVEQARVPGIEHDGLNQALNVLEAMRRSIPQARAWIEEQLNDDYKNWPTLLREALASAHAQGKLTPKTVRGHAMRLYLCHPDTSRPEHSAGIDETISSSSASFDPPDGPSPASPTERPSKEPEVVSYPIDPKPSPESELEDLF